MGWPIDMELKGCELIECWTHVVTFNVHLTLTLTLTFQSQTLKMLYLRNGRFDSLGMKGMWVGYDVGCTMGLTLGHGAWQIYRPSNGSMWNSYSFQPVGQWMGYSFTDLGAEGCCSLSILLYWIGALASLGYNELKLQPIFTKGWDVLPPNLTWRFDGLGQDCSSSSALAMEILQSCTKPLILGFEVFNSSEICHVSSSCWVAWQIAKQYEEFGIFWGLARHYDKMSVSGDCGTEDSSEIHLNSLWPGNAIWQHRTGSSSFIDWYLHIV